ncbi:CDC73-domain-containing protein [Lepidopterella palustris CBS 459.81]|uniref:CDC73-domain-containing protein n=1 Tax=Lepidopterella palustris CBS 459.81 TaxID=1314670 RepID=A0A8E2EE05_9PEZI|nr:CDC73-domain-containing protein [Lepidopterella palustris CBS 459.81]
MATTAQLEDPLLNLRRAIATNTPPILTTSANPISAADTQQNLALATHIEFNHDNAHRSFPLTTPTRFAPADRPVDLRSIYFAWHKKDVAVPEYIAATQRLNEELAGPGGAGGSVQNLVFVQKLDLIAWLQGASDESEYIKPLENEAVPAQAASSADVASGAAGGIAPAPSGGAAGGKAGKQVDHRLIEIYEGERKMGDRNSVLRGIKPTEFSHVRKIAATFLRHPSRPGGAPLTTSTTAPTTSPALVSNLKKPSRRLEPIILLSPSASSLLRMSNIKSFLDNGLYVPANSTEASATSSNLLHLTRLLPTIDTTRPLRFILVDTPDQFKPDYWSRVVAVFTTGQTWQFKGYKWTNPTELFGHALGVYVGWQGEEPPAVVKGWGRGVVSVKVDKWSTVQGTAGRWRDREVVEQVWGAIEESMRAKGWGKDGPGGR